VRKGSRERRKVGEGVEGSIELLFLSCYFPFFVIFRKSSLNVKTKGQSPYMRER